jgi:hypothetical protein
MQDELVPKAEVLEQPQILYLGVYSKGCNLLSWMIII